MNKMKNGCVVLGILLLLVVMVVPYSSAGVGLKWEKESILVNEEDSTCFSYSVYNPWPEDSYVIIELSEELREVLVTQEVDDTLIPANTASTNAIPIEFCFKVPKVYKEECLIGDSVVCKQQCHASQKIYEGEVIVRSVPSSTEGVGSSTSMSVSAPLRIKIRCNEHGLDFTVVYATLVILCLVIMLVMFVKKHKKIGGK